MSARTEDRTERAAPESVDPSALTVADVMRRRVVSISPEASLRALARLLDREEIGGVPVVSDEGEVVGVASRTDLVRYLAEDGETGAPEGGYFQLPDDGPPWFPDLLPEELGPMLEEHPVEEIMMPARFSVRPETSLPELARFLLRAGIHRALVFRGTELVGIVTTVDVLRAVAGEIEPA